MPTPLFAELLAATGIPIALDALAGPYIVNTGTSLTWSHTCSGTNRILLVGFFGDFNDVITSVTYAGTAMTLLTKTQNGGSSGTRWLYLYYTIAPSTGANNVIISASASIIINGGSISYTGAKQSGQPDNSAVLGTFTQNMTGTVTTIANNCWTILFFRSSTGSMSAGTGTTARIISGFLFGDSNGPVAPGSHSMVGDNSTPANEALIIASIAPA